MELLKLYLKNGQRENYYLILGEIVSRLNQFESMHDMNALELYYSVSVLMMQYINEQGISEKLAFRIGLYKAPGRRREVISMTSPMSFLRKAKGRMRVFPTVLLKN